MDTALAIAIQRFNKGSTALLDMMLELELVAGTVLEDYATKEDTARVVRATWKTSAKEKERRKRIEAVKRQEQQERRECEGEVDSSKTIHLQYLARICPLKDCEGITVMKYKQQCGCKLLKLSLFIVKFMFLFKAKFLKTVFCFTRTSLPHLLCKLQRSYLHVNVHVYVKMAAECNKTIYKCVQLMVLMLLSFFFEVSVFQFFA